MIKNGGTGLLYQYDSSITDALSAVYPEYHWTNNRESELPDGLAFSSPPYSGFWKQKTTQLKYFEWLFKEFEFQSYDDWYSITAQDIVKK